MPATYNDEGRIVKVEILMGDEDEPVLGPDPRD